MTLRSRLPRDWKVSLSEGSLWVKPEPINFKRAPGWRRRLVPSSGLVGGEGGSYAVTCPSACGFTIVLTSRPLREGRSWPK
eukprot:1183100-Alexandrium_andersonii.AAC.1